MFSWGDITANDSKSRRFSENKQQQQQKAAELWVICRLFLLKCSFWFKKKFDTFCCDGINPSAPGPSFPSSKK